MEHIKLQIYTYPYSNTHTHTIISIEYVYVFWPVCVFLYVRVCVCVYVCKCLHQCTKVCQNSKTDVNFIETLLRPGFKGSVSHKKYSIYCNSLSKSPNLSRGPLNPLLRTKCGQIYAIHMHLKPYL